METRNDDPAKQPIAALAANSADRDALTALGRLGRSARHATSAIICSIMSVDEPRHRAVCFDVLGSVLEDCEEHEAQEAVPLLACAIEDPKYHRMRGKIARTLLRIGMAGRPAIPALARTLRRGANGSVRVPTKAVLLWLGWRCWAADSRELQEDGFAVLEGFSISNQLHILASLLHADSNGSAVRERAQQLRAELLARSVAD